MRKRSTSLSRSSATVRVSISAVAAAGVTASPNFSASTWARDVSLSLHSMRAGGGVHITSARLSQKNGGVTAVPRGGVPS